MKRSERKSVICEIWKVTYFFRTVAVVYCKRYTCIHVQYYIHSFIQDHSCVMSRCTCRIRVVNSLVTFHLAHILISRAHHAFHIVICKRVSMNMIAPFECVLIQHLDRPDAHTRVCERWWTFFHSSTFHVFINYRNLRSKIKNLFHRISRISSLIQELLLSSRDSSYDLSYSLFYTGHFRRNRIDFSHFS